MAYFNTAATIVVTEFSYWIPILFLFLSSVFIANSRLQKFVSGFCTFVITAVFRQHYYLSPNTNTRNELIVTFYYAMRTTICIVCLVFMDTTTCFGCPHRILKNNTSCIKYTPEPKTNTTALVLSLLWAINVGLCHFRQYISFIFFMCCVWTWSATGYSGLPHKYRYGGAGGDKCDTSLRSYGVTATHSDLASRGWRKHPTGQWTRR